MSDTKTTCHKLPNVLTGARLVAEAPNYVLRGQRSPVGAAKDLRDWLKGFQEFLRDHRSQDAVHLEVVEDRSDLCSHCQQTWETQIEDGETQCANCGATVEG